MAALIAGCGGGGDGPSGPGPDTTPPPAPTSSLLTATAPVLTGSTTVTGTAGAVEASADVVVTNADASQRNGTTVQAVTTAFSDGRFQVQLVAQLGDRLEVVARDAAGNESPATSITAGPPLSAIQIGIESGDEQTGVVGQRLPESIVFKVSGPTGPVPGLFVEFDVLAGDGSLFQQRFVTNINGEALATYTLGPAQGTNQIAGRLELALSKQAVATAHAVGTPVVTSVSPAAVPAGNTVILQGQNFSPIAKDNFVFFGIRQAEVTAATSTALTTIVPTFATSDDPITVTLTGVTSQPFLGLTILPQVVVAPPLGSVELVQLPNNDGQIVLPFEDATQEYTLIVQSTRPSGQPLTTSLTAVRAPGAAVRVLSPSRAPVAEARMVGETRIRTLERRLLNELSGIQRRGGRAIALAQDIGSTRDFWVINTSEAVTLTDPDAFDQVTATLRFSGQNTLIYVDNATPAFNLTDAMINQIGIRFDQQTYPKNTQVFGDESDVDSNSKVIILLSPAVNALTTQEIADQGARILGFFFGPDLLPDPTFNPFSNGAEVFYSVVPDPDANFGAAEVGLDEAVDLLSSVFAHEFVHMIIANHKILLDPSPQAEALWLDEGLAHEGETQNNIDTQNRLRSALFLATPYETTLTGGGDSLDERGASWLFVRYLVDRFGVGVLMEMVTSTIIDIPNVEAATDRPYQTLFHEWSTTLLLDETGLNPDSRFDMPSIPLRADYEQAKQELAGGTNAISEEYLDPSGVQLPLNPPGSAFQFTQRGSSPIYLVITAAGRANIPVDIDGAPLSELQVAVIRTK